MLLNMGNIDLIYNYLSHDDSITKIILNFGEREIEMNIEFYNEEKSMADTNHLVFRNVTSFYVNNWELSKYDCFEIMLAIIENIVNDKLKISFNVITMSSRPPLELNFEFTEVEIEKIE